MDNFDYIIIGAGSAGCVMANRLSEDPKNRVLLIEAGGSDRYPLFSIPLLAGAAYYWKPTNWNYETEPQLYMDQRSIRWPRGKLLGGSSSINGMMYMRGNRNDYDNWARNGLPDWSYDDVLPYFKRSEVNPERTKSAFHGQDGELFTANAKGQNPLYDAFLKAGYDLGHPVNHDFNGEHQEGLGRYDFNIKKGRRVSSATAFLRPILSRPNLSLWTRTQVLRIELVEKKAESLRIIRDGAEQTVRANKEIILCAGAINSPQLLQLSGIGDPKKLKAVGVQPQHELSGVGKNLQDHLGVYMAFGSKEPVTLYGLFRPDRMASALIKAYFFGKGPATSIPLEAGGFLRADKNQIDPDIHITLIPGLNLETTRAGQRRHGYTINFYQLRPESRGSLHIVSPDPLKAPSMDPAYLKEESDRICFREGVKLASAIANHPVMARYRADEISPKGLDLTNDDEIDAWVRATAGTVFHPTGTCKMGVDDDAVVDSQLRVHGITGLRVADASVMPMIVSGNTSVPTMMIAERGADFILGRPPLNAASH